jgi:KDO2-lipid IV(A) lauroyltransferase
VTAHLGNFDLLACSQALRGVPLAIVSRELHRAGANRFWMRTRRRSGLEIIPDHESARRVLRWLRAGKALGLVVDQRTPPERGGMPAAFLGREVWTTTAPARLALRTGAALVPVRIERGADGDHDLYVEPELSPPAGEPDDAVAELTAEINRIVGRWVSLVPAQWMWLHRRFEAVGSPNRALSRRVPGAKLRDTQLGGSRPARVNGGDR